ncbi:hypothetical protein ACU6TU_08410 [Halomonas sp. LS-001]
MSDVNVSTMERPELEQTANDLGIKFAHNITDDTLRKKIAEQLGEAPPPAITAPPADTKRKRFEITIHQDSNDKQPVQVGVNGRMYVMKRGVKVTVPDTVVHVLENATRFEYDPRTMQRSEITAYPFTVHREL